MTTAMPGDYAQPPQQYQQSTAVIRSVGKCFLLLLVSFGLWGFAWLYHTTKEVSSKVNNPAPNPTTRTLLYIIPIVNLVMIYLAWQDIENYAKAARSESFSTVLWFLLTIFIPFVGLYSYPMIQSRMNDAHRAATNGQATEAPLGTLDKVLVGVGALIWLFYILIIIIAIAAS